MCELVKYAFMIKFLINIQTQKQRLSNRPEPANSEHTELYRRGIETVSAWKTAHAGAGEEKRERKREEEKERKKKRGGVC